MRVLTACLVGILGFGALATMAACSDSTDMGSAGAAGASGSAAAGSSGKAGAAGSTSMAGTGGGSDECGFESTDCSACIGDKCADEANACSDVDDCFAALYALPTCVCDATKNPETCIENFVSDNGKLGADLATCFNKNCAASCQ